MEEKYTSLDGKANSASKINDTYSSIRKQQNSSGGNEQLYAVVQKGKPLKPKKTLGKGNNDAKDSIAKTPSSSVPESNEQQTTGFGAGENEKLYAVVQKGKPLKPNKILEKGSNDAKDSIAKTPSSSIPESNKQQTSGFGSDGEGQFYSVINNGISTKSKKTMEKENNDTNADTAETSFSNDQTSRQLQTTHGGDEKRKKLQLTFEIIIAVFALAGLCIGVVSLIQIETSSSTMEIQNLIRKTNELEERLNKSNADLNNSIQAMDETFNELYNKTEELELIVYKLHGLFKLNGFQYMLTDKERGWNESRKWCKDQGGDLASVGMRNQSDLQNIGEALLKQPAWIGLTDKAHEGNFSWVDGVNYTKGNPPWSDMEPNGGESANCVEIYRNRQLNDRSCTEQLYGMCEISLLI